jgi:hypothetical protein
MDTHVICFLIFCFGKRVPDLLGKFSVFRFHTSWFL